MSPRGAAPRRAARRESRRIERLIANLTTATRLWGYRLGPYQTGLLIPREAAARNLGVVCAQRQVKSPCDHFHVKRHEGVGHCPLVVTGAPFNRLVEPYGPLSKKSQIGVPRQQTLSTFGLTLADVEAPGAFPEETRTPFCATAYPGKVADPERLRVDFSVDFPARALYPTHRRSRY